MAGGLMTSLRLGDGFAGPGGPSANLEARRSLLWGTWRLCTPSLILHYVFFLLSAIEKLFVSKQTKSEI